MKYVFLKSKAYAYTLSDSAQGQLTISTDLTEKKKKLKGISQPIVKK